MGKFLEQRRRLCRHPGSLAETRRRARRADAVKLGADVFRGTFETIDDEGRLVVRGGRRLVARNQRRRSAFRRSRNGDALMIATTDELVFVALGGVGEIGMNPALYGYGRGRGRNGSPSISASLSASAKICRASTRCSPISASSLERKSDLLGIAISHAHEDHYGALMDFWPHSRRRCS